MSGDLHPSDGNRGGRTVLGHEVWQPHAAEDQQDSDRQGRGDCKAHQAVHHHR